MNKCSFHFPRVLATSSFTNISKISKIFRLDGIHALKWPTINFEVELEKEEGIAFLDMVIKKKYPQYNHIPIPLKAYP